MDHQIALDASCSCAQMVSSVMKAWLGAVHVGFMLGGILANLFLKCSILTLAVFFFQSSALSAYVEVEVANGTSYKSQSFAGGGDIARPVSIGAGDTLGWSTSYTHTASEVVGSSGGTVKDNSHDFSGGLSLETASKFSLGGSFGFSSTPEENLMSYGPQLYVGKSTKYGACSKIKKGPAVAKTQQDSTDTELDDLDETESSTQVSGFCPSAGVELGVGLSNYRQTYSTSQTRTNGRVRTVSGESTIAQRSLSLGLKWKPLRWLSLKLTGTGYSYDKDVAQFAANLDANPTLSSSALGGLLSGFPSSSSKISSTFYWGDDWDLLVSASRSVAAIAQTLSYTNKLMLGYHLNDDWKLSAGVLTSRTEATTTSSEATDSQSLASISVDF